MMRHAIAKGIAFAFCMLVFSTISTTTRTMADTAGQKTLPVRAGDLQPGLRQHLEKQKQGAKTESERKFFAKVLKFDDQALERWFKQLPSADSTSSQEKIAWPVIKEVCWKVAVWVAQNVTWEVVCKAVEVVLDEIEDQNQQPQPEPPPPTDEQEVEIVPLPSNP